MVHLFIIPYGCILFNSISYVDNKQELTEKYNVIKKKGKNS